MAKGKLTYQEKRQKMEAWLRRADEVLEEYAEKETDDDPEAA